MTTLPETLTLKARLASDPEKRFTRPGTRTYERTDVMRFELGGRILYTDELPGLPAEVPRNPRCYAVVSLLTPIAPYYHRLVAWNADEDHPGIFQLRKDDVVEITVRPESFEAEDGSTIQQLVLVHGRRIKRAPHQAALPLTAPPSPPRFFTTCDGRQVPLVGEPIVARA